MRHWLPLLAILTIACEDRPYCDPRNYPNVPVSRVGACCTAWWGPWEPFHWCSTWVCGDMWTECYDFWHGHTAVEGNIDAMAVSECFGDAGVADEPLCEAIVSTANTVLETAVTNEVALTCRLNSPTGSTSRVLRYNNFAMASRAQIGQYVPTFISLAQPQVGTFFTKYLQARKVIGRSTNGTLNYESGTWYCDLTPAWNWAKTHIAALGGP